MLIREDVLRYRTAILAAASEHGAACVRLFGSAARGEDGPESDVDLLVALEPGRTLLDVARLELALEGLLGRRVDVVPESSLREPVLSTALAEAIAV